MAYPLAVRDEILGDEPCASGGNLTDRDLESGSGLLIGVKAHALPVAHGHEPEVQEILIPAEALHQRNETMIDPAEAAGYPAYPSRVDGISGMASLHGALVGQSLGNFL